MNKKFYITTACPYVNASPHIGFALEIVQTDTVARYHRLIGDETYFLTGTDENALKNVQAAEKAATPVKEFVDKNAKRFEDLKSALNLSHDEFFRTTKDKHFRGAQKLWLATKKEDTYKKTYKGLYCVGCETFYTPDELDKNGECFEHPGKKLDEVSEENYFFKLSNYQGWLTDLIEKDKLKIIPEIRKNEVVSFIKHGLNDFSISRSKERAHGWGVPVPNDPSQIMYVWYDALSYYITALGYADDDNLFKKFWLENENRVHVIGKGITRFHAIYWPAMLKSAGLPVPTTIFVHGYLTSGGQKISKSLGNVIDPFAQVEKYGTDTVRYYLLREIPSYGDGDYTEKRLKEIYNADLANGLGNLVSRVAKMAEHLTFPKKNYDISVNTGAALQLLYFDRALKVIWDDIKKADLFINQRGVWNLSGEQKEAALANLVNRIRQIATDLRPFLPQTSEKIEKQFKGPKIKVEKILFPRLG